VTTWGEAAGVNVLELFAGIGGMSLGLERAGMKVVGQVEIDPFCRAVLARHWPEVPRHDDVRSAIDWWRSQPRPRVDVVAGGYPCQPDSLAGKRRGITDERWLWPEMARVIHAVRPRYVIGENVMGHRTGGLRFVLRDLERLGYAARAGVAGAGEMGAPHRRQRIFILADAGSQRCGAGRGGAGVDGSTPAGKQGGAWAEPVRRDWWAHEPSVGRVAYGFPGRMDRIRALGNAVVPQVAQYVGELLLGGVWRE
jgi:DNA (cytosine-5)-methyltransferase 1